SGNLMVTMLEPFRLLSASMNSPGRSPKERRHFNMQHELAVRPDLRPLHLFSFPLQLARLLIVPVPPLVRWSAVLALHQQSQLAKYLRERLSLRNRQPNRHAMRLDG